MTKEVNDLMLVPAIPAAPATSAAPVDILASSLRAPTGRRHAHLHVRREIFNVPAGHTATVTGSLMPRLAHRRVTLQAYMGRHWRVIAHARTGERGRFRLRYVTKEAGSWPTQIRFHGGPHATRTTRRLGLLNAYVPAGASWYGGGGNLACGGVLTSSTMGVANKTLPCGTWLTLRYDGHHVRVQVIDRGPYVAGREFDLTEATKRALHFGDVGTVWATR